MGTQYRVIPLTRQTLKSHLWEERALDTSFGARKETDECGAAINSEATGELSPFENYDPS